MAPGPSAASTCVPAGAWVEPTSPAPRSVAAGDLLDRLARRPVVLLGERHDSAAHHRWQLATLQALQERSPDLSLGLEMVPRRLQPVLDRWVAGDLKERAFLEALDWPAIWGYDADLYLPILRFARDRRLPLLALNVDRLLVRRVRAEGFAAVPAREREGVGRPAPASAAYRTQLHRLWQHHPFVPTSGQRRPGLEDPSFVRFVESQLLWDRAMAEAIADRRRRHPGAPVVALIGNGHLAGGHGVPHQLRALGLAQAAWLLPWDGGLDCAVLQPGLATAVFGVVSRPPAGLRLGVYLETHSGRVEIRQVAPGSLAERSGLRVGDRITAIDGQPVSSARQVIERLAAHPAARPLGLTLRREGRLLPLQLALP
ncbi:MULTISPECIES: ChaN family lipoprotein [unclassified Cyanobium]|uniref:ChaN family lipoprotein n=1 Tax=unclassified Cyanobium TaxID=2627006 RepID=UPI0020CB838F|nr:MULTISPECIES: ChaN family lipoprotein [unclassified Cyanobium]MCP9835329.1 ChaN family lipoprotein [Cyanobium sp. La Preciosa 7G6]MCP9938153.1 ChaN family lipoprotein [Cyanobium sp. Aljojuca 7A6]